MLFNFITASYAYTYATRNYNKKTV